MHWTVCLAPLPSNPHRQPKHREEQQAKSQADQHTVVAAKHRPHLKARNCDLGRAMAMIAVVVAKSRGSWPRQEKRPRVVMHLGGDVRGESSALHDRQLGNAGTGCPTRTA